MELTGEIHCTKISNSRAVRKFVIKQISRWLMANHVAPEERAHFDVTIDRQGEGHHFDCRVKILTKNKIWTAYSCTQDLNRALKVCLARMVPRLTNPAFSSPP